MSYLEYHVLAHPVSANIRGARNRLTYNYISTASHRSSLWQETTLATLLLGLLS